MTQCPSCKSNLIADGLNPGQPIRCAHCQTSFMFGQAEAIPTHRLAWRSCWLGLLSIPFLFLAGIPAIYYGVRSLRRMRFVKPKPSDRAAAIAGTAMGGCFGVALGLMIVGFSIIALIGYMTYFKTDKPDEVTQKCDEVFEYVMPPGVTPVSATSVFNNHFRFEFADDKKSSGRSIRILLMHDGISIQTNRDRFMKSLKNKTVNNQRLGKRASTEMLNWEINGEPVEVTKSVFLRKRTVKNIEQPISELPPNSESGEVEPEMTIQYIAYLLNDRGHYGLVVVYEPEKFRLSEPELRKLFADTHVKRPVSSGE